MYKIIFNQLKNKFINNLPIINFCISFTALTFQVTILNPWHLTISKQINHIEQLVNKK